MQQRPMTSEEATRASVALSQLSVLDDALLWIQQNPSTGEFQLYGQWLPSSSPSSSPKLYSPNAPFVISPAGLSINSRVNEYGGVSYCGIRAEQGCIELVYVNSDDQQLWQLRWQDGVAEVSKLTDEPNSRFGAPVLNPHASQLVAICERHVEGKFHPEHSLVSIDLTSGQLQRLHQGFDFYDRPTLHPEGKELSWVAWNHPNQPWTSTHLCRLALDEHGQAKGAVQDYYQPGYAFSQPLYRQTGQLLCLSDHQNWWGVYEVSGHELSPIYDVANSELDVCAAPWQFGQSSYVASSKGVFVSGHHQGIGQLMALNEPEQTPAPRCDAQAYTLFRYLCLSEKHQTCFAIVSSPETEDQVVGFEWQPKPKPSSESGASGLSEHSNPRSLFANAEDGSRIQGFWWQSSAGEASQANKSKSRQLIVSIHGGPTAAAYPTYSNQRAFWLSHGFDVLEVNHRGSTGFGRDFRQALKGRWAKVDVQDTLTLTRALLAQAPSISHAFIRGSSAGGLTVLSCLAESDVFAAGASLYGVTDLQRLHECTHKFESQYVPWLVCPTFPPRSEAEFALACEARSPLNKVASIKAPVLFLQGEEDRVVPATQTQAMHRALVDQGVDSQAHYFANERHGFKQPQNQQKALELELAFYRRVSGQ